MRHFKFYHKQDILSLTSLRRYETKLGERLLSVGDPGSPEASLQASPARYVLFGIPEDIGVKANRGVGGADTLWLPFLQTFLNIQSNDFLAGEEILLLGHFDFGDLLYLIDTHAQGEDEKTEAYRHAVMTIDEDVEELVKLVTASGKIPLVVGGGHNNAYPLIKGAAKGWHKAGRLPLAQLNCINLDAHCDYRPLEGRHSGNAFRYAEEDGYLQKYCVIGLQENYLPQNLWVDIVNNPFIDCISFEDIYVREKRSFMQAVAHAQEFTDDGFCGIELDLDAVEGVLSSAATPCGVPAADARRYVTYAAAACQPAYLHICEGACRLSDGRTDALTGKLVSFLVSDFVKAFNEQLSGR
ncbi:MAG TPA: arginase family protein [Chitinophagaceae bacterium]|nr:arginase family protein [Chitinophagaceae bacterium]